MHLFLIAILMMSALAACSGSGGGASSGTTVIASPTASGDAILSFSNSTLQFSEPATVTATFKKADGTPASGISVVFTTTLGSLSPANGTATTNSNGVATVTLTSGTTSGQGQVTATAAIDGSQVTKSGFFTVVLPTLHLSDITIGQTPLSYGGSTSVSVTILDSGNATYTGQEVDVTFTSTQSALGNATISSPVRSVNGVATTTYKATAATGTDTISASISGATKTASLTINPLSANSITFVSASPANIGLKGMGGAGIQETSTVTFKVLDTSGQPKANQQVDFTLNTTVGGLALTSSSGSSGPDGTVTTIVQAGTIATPVRVTATLRGITPVIATQSDQLVVSTGVPAQDGFSVSIQTFNPEAWSRDGVVDAITVRLSDHFHNPVPDGTSVYFTTSGGSIQPSCSTTGGSCSVNWTSQNPRPSSGRAVILAYAVGEETFLDLNGNGLADAGEFTDDSEAFRDDNESGVREAAETFIDFNSDGTFNGPDGMYNGILQGTAYSGASKSKHIYSNSTIVMASSTPIITNSCGAAFAVAKGSSTECSITVSDINGNTMPSGTTVSFAVTTTTQGTTVVGATTTNKDLTVAATGYTVPNTTSSVFPITAATIADPSLTTSARGLFTVTVTTPGGRVTTSSYRVN